VAQRKPRCVHLAVAAERAGQSAVMSRLKREVYLIARIQAREQLIGAPGDRQLVAPGGLHASIVSAFGVSGSNGKALSFAIRTIMSRNASDTVSQLSPARRPPLPSHARQSERGQRYWSWFNLLESHVAQERQIRQNLPRQNLPSEIVAIL
jgi:hypothetical protein